MTGVQTCALPIFPLHLMGRDGALAAIETALRRNEGGVAITVLHGMRGVGKTTLAAAYAEYHRCDYLATWWIRAQTERTLRADLAVSASGWAGSARTTKRSRRSRR